MFFQIDRCYDSHIHLLATGMMSEGLQLSHLKSADEISELQIKDSHFRGEWLVGFGWDQHKWQDQQMPRKDILDKYFPNFPVAFSRADGHAVWLNSKALQIANYYNKTEQQNAAPPGGVIVRDSKGWPTGVFIDNAKLAIDMIIPPFSSEQKNKFLLAAINEFNRNGFTHVRDMSGFKDQYELLRRMDENNQLTLYIDLNMTCEDIQDFQRALSFAIEARENQTKHIDIPGVKFYFDGALGSHGAFLSQNYVGTDTRGFILWDIRDVEEVITRTWQNNFEVSVHTIGDQAADLIATQALRIQDKGIQGRLNFEHAEILRDETIEKISRLNATCHMQPCHWLSDRRWLKDKLGSLYRYAFPWQKLRQNNISIQWGSDSPIERPNVFDTIQALEESPKAGIPAFGGNYLSNYCHPRKDWGSNCHSVFENGRVTSVIFDGKEILKT